MKDKARQGLMHRRTSVYKRSVRVAFVTPCGGVASNKSDVTTQNFGVYGSSLYTIGLMSGTSLDGIDAVLLKIDAHEDGERITASPAISHPLSPSLIEFFRQLQTVGENELALAQEAGIQLAHGYADAIAALLAKTNTQAKDILAIGAHGQTVRHRPQEGYSVQILNGAWLAELTGINVVCDFRARDIAAGGQGAPLVPAFHQYLQRVSLPLISTPWAFLNLGGMANISWGWKDQLKGGDCGPANVLLDAWIHRHFPQVSYDKDGAWANEGAVNEKLLQRLMSHPYFSKPLPKSCGYEDFNMAWLNSMLTNHRHLAPSSVQATLVEFTAKSIALFLDALMPVLNTEFSHHLKPMPFWVFGGGVNNATLMRRLNHYLPSWQIRTTDELGIHPQSMEAAAFAWFAAQTMRHHPSNAPSVTGAKGLRVLGAVYFK